MTRFAFFLSLLCAVACSSNKKDSGPSEAELSYARDIEAQASGASANGKAVLRRLDEIVEIETGNKVGMVYTRDHGNGRMVSWVYDAKGGRRGYITADNRGFAYEYVAGKRTAEAYFVASDVPAALARRIIGSTRAVKLNSLDIRKWAEQGYVEKGGTLPDQG
ncbi:MAG: hypothetical protein AAGD14_05010 [Planctomycetota bacterium]